MYSTSQHIEHHFAHSKLILKKLGVVPRVFNGYFKTLVLKKPVLRTIEFAVTADCNVKCEMCYASKIKKNNEKILVPAEIHDIWLQAKKLGAFSAIVSGGEPTTRDDILDVLRSLEPSKSLIAFVTNSINMSRGLFKELIDAGVNTFHFSLDSDNPEKNDEIRTYKGHFAKVLENIKMAKEFNANAYISTVIGHHDTEKTMKMVRFAKEQGVGIVFSLVCPLGNWAGKKENVLTREDWHDVQKIMRENPHIRSDWTINFSMKVECPGGREKVAISPYGEVMGCGMNYISFGNVREEPLETIWRRMANFKHFQRRPADCLIGADHEYIDEYLIPIAGASELPVRISEHPRNPMSLEELSL
ncbi:MAG: radical SAM protein [Oligoflexales bacterium]|nr:radical SAM protein [Oligoflexales bacterium]